MRSYFIILFIIAGTSVVSSQRGSKLPQNVISCEARPNVWKCCASTHPMEGFSLTSCADLRFLTQDLSLRMIVTLNNYTYSDEIIPGRSPPVKCFNVYYFLDTLSICFVFYDMRVDFLNHQLGGCLRVQGQLTDPNFIQIRLGCFGFPSKRSQAKEDLFVF